MIPLLVALLFFKKQWKQSFLIMIAAMIIDVDHLLAVPVYDPTRCSIGFHPLHGLIPICIYCVLCFIPKCRLIGIGLVIHMVLDFLDCLWINGLKFT